MAFIGNRSGPRESEIVLSLGPEYFGISREAWLADVEEYEESEARRAVVPVKKDPVAGYFITFSRPGGRQERFFLSEHGYDIPGEVEIWSEGESSVEVNPPPENEES